MAAPKRKAPPKNENTSPEKKRRTGRTKKVTSDPAADTLVQVQDAPSAEQTQTEVISLNSDEDAPRSPLTEAQLAHFRAILIQRRREILGDVDIMSGGDGKGNRQDNSGDLSSMPIHMADIGTDNYEQEFTLGLIESDRKQLEDIDRALAKIPRGEYGICEGTNKPINLARLEAKPEARYSIEFARKLEKGLVRLPEGREDPSYADSDDYESESNAEHEE